MNMKKEKKCTSTPPCKSFCVHTSTTDIEYSQEKKCDHEPYITRNGAYCKKCGKKYDYSPSQEQKKCDCHYRHICEEHLKQSLDATVTTSSPDWQTRDEAEKFYEHSSILSFL